MAKKCITFRFSEEVYFLLQAQADKAGITRTQYIEQLLREKQPIIREGLRPAVYRGPLR